VYQIVVLSSLESIEEGRLRWYNELKDRELADCGSCGLCIRALDQVYLYTRMDVETAGISREWYYHVTEDAICGI